MSRCFWFAVRIGSHCGKAWSPLFAEECWQWPWILLSVRPLPSLPGGVHVSVCSSILGRLVLGCYSWALISFFPIGKIQIIHIAPFVNAGIFVFEQSLKHIKNQERIPAIPQKASGATCLWHGPLSFQWVLQGAAGHCGQLRCAPAGHSVVLLPPGTTGMPWWRRKKAKFGPEML